MADVQKFVPGTVVILDRNFSEVSMSIVEPIVWKTPSAGSVWKGDSFEVANYSPYPVGILADLGDVWRVGRSVFEVILPDGRVGYVSEVFVRGLC